MRNQLLAGIIILASLASGCGSSIGDTANESGSTTAAERTDNEPVASEPGLSTDNEPVRVPPADAVPVSYGESYGQCIGYCDSTLSVAGGVVELRLEANDGQPPLITKATLSDSLAVGLVTLVGELERATLQPVYGCPDCADGGATTLLLSPDGDLQTHQWEVGNPPETLAEIDTTLAGVLYAMRSCEATVDISLSTDCVPVD